MKSPSLIVIGMVNDILRSLEGAARQRLLRSTNELIGIIAALMSNVEIAGMLGPASAGC